MRQQGFTLIELVIYILVFAVGVTAIMSLMPQILASGSNSTIRLRGVQVAQAVMEEITAKRWDETTPNGGGAATTPTLPASFGPDGELSIQDFDDVDDYHRTAPYNSDTDFGLTEGYTIYVTVSSVSLSGTTFNAGGGVSYKEIHVRVNSATLDEDYNLYAVKGDF